MKRKRDGGGKARVSGTVISKGSSRAVLHPGPRFLRVCVCVGGCVGGWVGCRETMILMMMIVIIERK